MDALSLLKIIITAPFGIVYFLLLSNWRFSKQNLSDHWSRDTWGYYS